MKITKHDVVVAGGAALGAAMAALPALQALPVHATPAEVVAGLAAGSSAVIASLVSHGIVSAKLAPKVTRVINEAAPEVASAVALIPGVQKTAGELSGQVASLTARVSTLESKPSTGALVDAAKAVVAASAAG